MAAPSVANLGVAPARSGPAYRHVAAVSVQQRSYVTHSVRVWELRNVHRVLRSL